MNKVWGKHGKVHVRILLIMDYYNHWMFGVDLADQNISYHHPDLLFCCTLALNLCSYKYCIILRT